MNGTLALVLSGTAGIAIGVALIPLGVKVMDRLMPASSPLPSPNGPPCDRCDEPTGKPWLWQQPRTSWHCEACAREVTQVLLSHRAFTREYWAEPGSST